MTDQELLQAIGQIVETALDNRLDAKLEPLRKDIRELKDSVVSMDVRINQLEAIGKYQNGPSGVQYGPLGVQA